MSSQDDIAVSVRNLTKTYRLFRSPVDRIKQALTLGQGKFHDEFTALKDISFDIRKGETVGIIGKNGSGKSTLLQLICGILKPTSGSIQVNGRVSALLELGAGFNPEFTGRENVYFQGTLMGFSRAEMDTRFDSIAAFADIGEFIDQPVRTYSSGMFVRLAFSVAIHVEPDLLVIDEALAVGDFAFQRKCYALLERFHNTGCTIIFVSHDLSTIISLSNKVLWLSDGSILSFDSPKRAVDLYCAIALSGKRNNTSPGEMKETFSCDSPASAVVYPTNGAEILNPRILDLDSQPINILRSGMEYRYVFDVRFDKDEEKVRFGMLIKTPDGRELGGLVSAPQGEGISVRAGQLYKQCFTFKCTLLPGSYFLNAGVVGADGHYLHRIIDAAMFSVSPEPLSRCTGIVDFSPDNAARHACQ